MYIKFHPSQKDLVVVHFTTIPHFCPKMHLTLILGTLHKTDLNLLFSYDFMFDRIICVLVRIYGREHFVMSIIRNFCEHFYGHGFRDLVIKLRIMG